MNKILKLKLDSVLAQVRWGRSEAAARQALKKAILSSLILTFGLMGNATASSNDLGLTPSHVCGLWENINSATLKLGELYSTDEAWLASQAAMRAGTFDGKKPGDVLVHLSKFRDKLDRVNKKLGLGPTKVLELKKGVKITPSIVFLNTGYVLDSVVASLLPKLPPEQMISPYFAMHSLKDKKPSDAYALVDLANRRLDQLLNKTSL